MCVFVLESGSSLEQHTGANGLYVEGLVDIEVESEADIQRIMTTGAKNRSVGVTNMNEHSSRSHSVLTVKVEGSNTAAGITLFGKLHLIDLAGSERLAKSQATGTYYLSGKLEENQGANSLPRPTIERSPKYQQEFERSGQRDRGTSEEAKPYSISKLQADLHSSGFVG